MKKLKIYLDTSVISHLDAPDVPEKMADTIALWEEIKEGSFHVIISNLVIIEINNCREPKRSFMQDRINEIDYELVESNNTTLSLAQLYIGQGGLPSKSAADAEHLAIATLSNCNAVLSWNNKHMVNLRAVQAVESVNIREGYAQIRILSPSMVLNYYKE